MVAGRQDREFSVPQSSTSDQEQSRVQPFLHPSGFHGIEGLQPGREYIAGRTSPGESLTENSSSSTLPVGTLPWNPFNQDPDLTVLPASSPTFQSLQEHTPKICCGESSRTCNSRCENKLTRRERRKLQRRQNKLLARKNGGKNGRHMNWFCTYYRRSTCSREGKRRGE